MSDPKARQDYEHYRDEENLRPQGPPRKRKSGLSEVLPVRLSPELLDALRRRARAEERSVSWLVRRAIERLLDRSSAEIPASESGDKTCAVGIGRVLHARLRDAAEREGVEVSELANQVIAYGLGAFEERSRRA